MNYLGITKSSIADGIGIRVVLWVSGCRLNCPGCHNPESHDLNAGEAFTIDTIQDIMKALDHDYVAGLTLSGGHPFEEENLTEVTDLMRLVKDRFPDKTIWAYTGFTYEKFIEDENRKKALQYIDVLVDGPFIAAQRDVRLAFRGSTNQRLIDIPATLEKGFIVEYIVKR